MNIFIAECQVDEISYLLKISRNTKVEILRNSTISGHQFASQTCEIFDVLVEVNALRKCKKYGMYTRIGISFYL